ncbi:MULTISPECIES: AAA-like domain-containing protein [unclassified Thermosynechococcus]|uniref:AAA-like domain-containing protein n=1 Tax=unclassified Thermosynechococcus TaxID=2622553 RepID=UPI00267332D2|nr:MULTISPECIES: AAA-like domain-containing protein [unclassified Thermosynechococcus]WKT82754.1 AAA-like domain-containing protein [Thermosynechococcus sp. HY596]WNC61881.1 AAA-like domain-containing protein [Thermosynechococcus sp. HY591]WNC64435.1 AAA-like domain-containing protein [Thermosynechococcus sp. HY593]
MDAATTYQVGGSLPTTSAVYVRRQADADLLAALTAGEFCYILNSRQMGKSSLRVQVTQQLMTMGYRCAALDITKIGSQNIQPEQWYASFVGALIQGFQLTDVVSLRSWWRDRQLVSPIQRLSDFVETVLLAHTREPLVIFIDEIDSLLSLPFSTDDFFAWIRACYNQRADYPEYQRLTFALFGVATPDQLIQDKQRTPFNIGCAIDLQGFTLAEATPLLKGIAHLSDNPDQLLAEILNWTGGQPFLTQKLCRLLQHHGSFMPTSTLSQQLAQFVQEHILQDWERQDEPEHLKTIRNRLLADEQRIGRLLGLYQRVLETGGIPLDGSSEQRALALTGLVCQRQGKLQVFNPIYAHIFDAAWVEQQLAQLRPYSEEFQAWLRSGGSDSSRLLRGQALEEALIWASGKSLSDLDYQYLSASQEANQKAIQDTLLLERQEKEAISAANRILEAARQKASRLTRRALMALGIVSVISLGVAAILAKTHANLQAAQESLALEQTSNDLLEQFQTQELPALLAGIEAGRHLKRLVGDRPLSQYPTTRPLFVLNFFLDHIQARNQWQSDNTPLMAAFLTADGQQFSISESGLVEFWRVNGERLSAQSLEIGNVKLARISPAGDRVGLLNNKGEISLWRVELQKLIFERRLPALPINNFRFSPEGQELTATTTTGDMLRWSLEGELLATIPTPSQSINSLSYAIRGDRLATADEEGWIRVWSRQGELLQAWQVQADLPVPQTSLTYLSNGQLATVGKDGTLRLWNTKGQQINQWRVSAAPVYFVGTSPVGYRLLTLSTDNTMRLWQPTGELIAELGSHERLINTVSFNPTGSVLLSSDRGGQMTLWYLDHHRTEHWFADQESIWTVALDPQAATVVTGGKDGRVKYWRRDGTLLATTPVLDPQGINQVLFSPSGQRVAIATKGGKLVIWNLADRSQQIWQLPIEAPLYTVSMDPQRRYLAAGDEKGTIYLVDLQRPENIQKRKSEGEIWSLSFHPTLPLLASTGSAGTIEVWNFEGDRLAYRLNPDAGWLAGLEFSANGQFLAAAGESGSVYLWSIHGKTAPSNPRVFRAHQRSIVSLGLSPDGEMIATASPDRSVRVWNQRGQLITLIDRISAIPYSVDVSGQDELYVAIGTEDDEVLISPLATLGQLLTSACDWLKDYRQQNPAVAQACP